MPDQSTLLNTGPVVWILLVALLGVAALVGRTVLGIPVRQVVLLAGTRALAQLAIVAVMISQLGRSAWLSAAVLIPGEPRRIWPRAAGLAVPQPPDDSRGSLKSAGAHEPPDTGSRIEAVG